MTAPTVKVVILAGGRGTRLAEETGTRPKPMVEIGGMPLLWHLMGVYAGHGLRDFIVACGYKGALIKEFFHNFAVHHSDFTVDLHSGHVDFLNAPRNDWHVSVLDTGLDTMTGGRLLRLRDLVAGGTFMVTYGDGLGNVDVSALLAFHRAHGRLATVTAVRPPARFGDLTIDGDCVRAFAEKPQGHEGWINGGFFVFEPGVLDYIDGDDISLEREPLERIAREGQLMAYRHHGFWQPMDTLREKLLLEDLWASGNAPLEIGDMTFWKNKNVFVTGATGLLGSHLTEELLSRGARVTVLVRDWVPDSRAVSSSLLPRCQVIRGELEDHATLLRVMNEYEIDTVFHLGAQTIVGTASRSAMSTFESNIRGTWCLLEAAKQCMPRVQRVIVASSDKAYGAHETLPYTEDAPLQGRFPYDVSKSCTDLISFSYWHTYRVPIAVTRCGNLFGAGDLNFNRLIPGTIRSALQGERPVIRSDGTFVRDYFYVRDAVNAYLQLAERVPGDDFSGEAFNFGTETPLTVIEVVEQLLGVMGIDGLSPVIRGEATHEIPMQFLDCAKARARMDWRPNFSFTEGLSETVSWYRDWLAARDLVR